MAYNPKEDKVRVTIEPVEGAWRRALNLARRTVGKKALDKDPSNGWRHKILLQEHSPIRAVEYIIHFEDIRQWVTVHLVRHWLGFIPFVHSQRQDRRVLNCERDELPQGSLNDMDVLINAQSLINVSRKRLCSTASPETRHAWTLVKEEMKKLDPEMARAMVPECVYRGFCPYFDKCCGYCKSEDYQKQLADYRSTFSVGEPRTDDNPPAKDETDAPIPGIAQFYIHDGEPVHLSPEQIKAIEEGMYDENGWKNIGGGLKMDRNGYIAGGLRLK